MMLSPKSKVQSIKSPVEGLSVLYIVLSTRLKLRTSYFVLCTFFLLCTSLSAQPKKPEVKKITTRILFIYDASNSMNAKWQNNVKHTVAKQMLSEMLDSLAKINDLELALRMYGHQKHYPPQDCDDTRLEVAFSKGNIPNIKKKLDAVQPKGTTPIAASLIESAKDFPPCDHCKNVIILITDGVEECGGDLCAVALALQQKGIILKPFIIGIGLDPNFKKTFDCVGNYYDVSNEAQFKQVLGIVISQALNSTTMQVNLLDQNGKPNETNVSMTFYNHFNKKIEYDFMHSINYKGVPDTVPVNPSVVYDIQVHSIPSVRKDSVIITPGIHTTVGISVPQGNLHLFKPQSNSLLENVNVLVKKKGSCEVLNVQKMGDTEKYLIGNYDLLVQTLPIKEIKDVQISQSHTTKIEIPEPGVVHIMVEASGYGSILHDNNGKLELIYNLPETATKKSVYLLPGKYRIVFRPKNVKEVAFTLERTFEIKSGISTTVNLF